MDPSDKTSISARMKEDTTFENSPQDEIISDGDEQEIDDHTETRAPNIDNELSDGEQEVKNIDVVISEKDTHTNLYQDIDFVQEPNEITPSKYDKLK
jgi:hypothetical protein